MSLGDVQARLGRAVISGEMSDVAPLLIGGRHIEKRLEIHHRHYQASLVKALLDRFQATTWLVGAAFMTEAAKRFVREHPPHAPCIAEYGEEFPRFLSTCPAGGRIPYLRGFAELEWCLGEVSVAVDRRALSYEDVAEIPRERLADASLMLQPGVRYLEAAWPIDDLIKLYLTDSAPDQLCFTSADTWIEVRGARGEFQINRLDAGTFVFRRALLKRQSLGDAAELALNADTGFDPSRALAAVIADRLVTALGAEAPRELR